MKIVINPFVRIVLIIGAWILCIRQIYLDFNHTHFLEIIFPALVLLASIISLLSFLVDYVRYKNDKMLVYFAPTIISLLCIATLIATNLHLKQQDKTPTVFHAYAGLFGISIDFRENGTYKCEDGGFMGDSYYIRGHYTIRDSVIYLDKSNFFDQLKTDRLLMKTIPHKVKKAKKNTLLKLLLGPSRPDSRPDTLPETYLFQLDHKGDTIPSAIVLRVNKQKF